MTGEQRTSTGQLRGVNDLAVDDGGPREGRLMVAIDTAEDGHVLIEVPRWLHQVHGDWAWKTVRP